MINTNHRCVPDEPDKTPLPSPENRRVLECSSKGDARFSAFYANVEICKETKSIEEHYQLAKRFRKGGRIVVPQKVMDAKGKAPINFIVGGEVFDVKDLTSFYVYLWVKYLDQSPDLVKVLAKYDDYSDMFKGKSINCQADVIRDYMRDRAKLVKLHKDFFTRMRFLEQ